MGGAEPILFAFGTKGLICKALSGGPKERPRGGSDSGRPSGLPALRFKANSIGLGITAAAPPIARLP